MSNISKPSLKILHALSYRDWTGGSQFCLQLSQALQGLGHSVVIACARDKELWRRAEAAGIPVAPVVMRNQFDPIGFWRFMRAVSKDNFDVVHVMTSRDYVAGYLAAKLRRVGAVVLSRHIAFPVRWHRKFIYALPDVIVSVSGAVKRALVQSGIPASKVLVIHNGIDLKAFLVSPNARRKVREELGISEDQPVCIVVGRLRIAKGHTYYFQAAKQILKRFPGAVFLIAGTGREEKNLKEECHQLGIAEHVLFLGFRKDVADLFYAADVSVIPSVWEEPFSYVLLESMAASKPVVAFAVGGNPEIVEDGVTGFLVEPRRSDLLAEAISKLLADADLRRSMGEAGRQRAERYFTLERMAQRYEQLYFHILNNRSASLSK